MDSRRKCNTERTDGVEPRQIFLKFISNIVNKNQDYLKSNPPPGLTPIQTLSNIFFCFVKQLDPIMDSDIQDFPFVGFFSDKSFLFDPVFQGMERIGGTLSHLKSELVAVIPKFAQEHLTQRQKDNFILMKQAFLLFAYSVVPEVKKSVKLMESLF